MLNQLKNVMNRCYGETLLEIYHSNIYNYSVVKLCIVKGSNNQLYLKARDNMDSTIYLTMFGYLLVSNSIK